MAVPPSNSAAPAVYHNYTPENVVKTATGNGWTVTATVKFGAEEYDITWFTPQHLNQQELDTTLKERVNKYYQLHVRFVDDKISKVIWRPDDNTITRYYNDPTQHKIQTKQIGDWTFHSNDPQHESTKNVMGKLAKREREILSLNTQIANIKVEIANPQNLPNKPTLEAKLLELEKKHQKTTLDYANAERRLERMKKAQQLSTLYRNSFPAAHPPQGQQVPPQTPPAPVTNQGQGNPLPQPVPLGSPLPQSQGQPIPLSPQSSQGSPQSAPQSVPKLNTLPLAAPLNAGLNPAPQLQRAILIPDHISVPIDKQSLEQLFEMRKYCIESGELLRLQPESPKKEAEMVEIDTLYNRVLERIKELDKQNLQNSEPYKAAIKLEAEWRNHKENASNVPENFKQKWTSLSTDAHRFSAQYVNALEQAFRYEIDIREVEQALQTELTPENRQHYIETLEKTRLNLHDVHEFITEWQPKREKALTEARDLYVKMQESSRAPTESIEAARRKQSPLASQGIANALQESVRRPRGPARDSKASPFEIENIWNTPNTPPVTPPQATPPGRP